MPPVDGLTGWSGHLSGFAVTSTTKDNNLKLLPTNGYQDLYVYLLRLIRMRLFFHFPLFFFTGENTLVKCRTSTYGTEPTHRKWAEQDENKKTKCTR